MGPEQGGSKKMDGFKANLKRCGAKLTNQRMIVYQIVAESEDHPDAESVYKAVRKKMPMISLDTVYRTLWLLQDLELIGILGARDRVRFDGNMKPHHHFVCKKCGRMRDFYSVEYDRLKIPKTVNSLGSAEIAQVEVRGICNQCSKKSNVRERALPIKEGR